MKCLATDRQIDVGGYPDRFADAVGRRWQSNGCSNPASFAAIAETVIRMLLVARTSEAKHWERAIRQGVFRDIRERNGCLNDRHLMGETNAQQGNGA